MRRSQGSRDFEYQSVLEYMRISKLRVTLKKLFIEVPVLVS